MRERSQKKSFGTGLVLPTGFHIEASSTEQLIVEGCTGIQLYEQERIRLGIGRRALLVVGDGLTIESMFGSTLILRGRIASIEYI